MRGGLFFLLLLLLSFILSLLSEGKMDWGLFLHCAALTFTLAGAPRSGKCHGGGTTSGLSLGNRGLATGPGGPGAGPDPRPVAGNFVPEVGVGGVRAPVPPGRVRPPTLFSALWGRRIKRGARSRKLRTANYLRSGSSHRQLNKSRLRYLRDNEHLERKALSSPFLFFFLQSVVFQSTVPATSCLCTCGQTSDGEPSRLPLCEVCSLRATCTVPREKLSLSVKAQDSRLREKSRNT